METTEPATSTLCALCHLVCASVLTRSGVISLPVCGEIALSHNQRPLFQIAVRPPARMGEPDCQPSRRGAGGSARILEPHVVTIHKTETGFG